MHIKTISRYNRFYNVQHMLTYIFRNELMLRYVNIIHYFRALTNTKTATAPIIPPKTSNTCNGNPPVAVTVPAGACAETNASSLFPDFCILEKPAICSCALGGGVEERTET